MRKKLCIGLADEGQIQFVGPYSGLLSGLRERKLFQGGSDSGEQEEPNKVSVQVFGRYIKRIHLELVHTVNIRIIGDVNKVFLVLLIHVLSHNNLIEIIARTIPWQISCYLRTRVMLWAEQIFVWLLEVNLEFT